MRRHRTRHQITAATGRTPVRWTPIAAARVTEIPSILEVVERPGLHGSCGARGVEEYRQRCDTRQAARDQRKRYGASRRSRARRRGRAFGVGTRTRSAAGEAETRAQYREKNSQKNS